jgi:hypothetical protein
MLEALFVLILVLIVLAVIGAVALERAARKSIKE